MRLTPKGFRRFKSSRLRLNTKSNGRTALKIFRNFSDSYNTTFIELFSWKLTVARTFIGELKKYIINFSVNKYNSLSKLKNSRSGVAVICALGPSIYEDKKALRELLTKASNNKALFVINHYLTTEFADIKPSFQVLSDDNFFNNPVSLRYVKLVENFPEIDIITRVSNNYIFTNNNVIYFSGLNFPTVLKTKNPKFPVGYSDISIIHTMAIANFIGFSQIVVCGFDNNRFMQIHSVKPGEILFKGMHAYDSDIIENWGTRDTMAKVLASHLSILKSLNLFKKLKIFIIGESSLVDIFPKIQIREALDLFQDE